MPQVFCTYPGADFPIRCTYTRTLGVMPNVAIMHIVPQQNVPFANGTLTFNIGTSSVNFFNCRLDAASIQVSRDGHIAVLRILDRRWKWEFPSIDGVYNVRRADGTIEASSARSAQQLAAILLTELGEFGFNVSALPSNDFPPIEWDCTPVRSALSQLCEEYGCDVNLDWITNTAIIVRLGTGTALPDTTELMTAGQGADFSEVPDQLVVCGDFVLVQSKIKLEAVGVDTDGEVKPIDDLSYAPTDGWETQNEPNDLLPDAEEDIRHLANSSVYRLFRATSQADGTQNVPGYAGVVADISQLYPLKNSIVRSYDNGAGIDRQEAYVTGVFDLDGGPQPLTNSDVNTRLNLPFRLIGERGLVLFNTAVTKRSNDLTHEAPELYLVTSYHVKHPVHNQYERFTLGRVIAANGTPALAVPRPNLQQTIYAEYEDDGVTVASTTDNFPEVVQDANIMLDTLQSQYFASATGHGYYRGFPVIPMSGTIRQMTWSVDRHRKKPAPAMTIAALNSEPGVGALRYRERSRLLAAEHYRTVVGVDHFRIRKLRREQGIV